MVTLTDRITSYFQPKRRGCWCCGREDERTAQGYWFCNQHQPQPEETSMVLELLEEQTS